MPRYEVRIELHHAVDLTAVDEDDARAAAKKDFLRRLGAHVSALDGWEDCWIDVRQFDGQPADGPDA